MTRTAHTDAHSGLPGWPELSRPLGGTAGALALFAVAYAALVLLGYELKEGPKALTIIWPAAGLLMFVLWLVPWRLWPAFVATQVGVELLMGALLPGPFAPLWAIALAAANTLDAVVGATLMRVWFRRPRVVHIRRLVQFILASAAGSAAGAALGALAAVQLFPELDYLHQFQLWWAGNWLGSLVVVPVAYAWARPLRRLYHMLPLESRRELALFIALLLPATVWVFSTPSGGAASLLQLPVILAAIIAAAAYRLPPRWATLLAATAVFIAAALASRGQGPFVVDNPFVRLAQLQLFLAALVLLAALLTTAIGDLRITLQQLAESETRYRNFVENSNEAVWRVELDSPMTVTMPTDRQIDWLRRHAYIAECNLSYGQLDPLDRPQLPLPWRREVPWSAIYEQHLEQAARRQYSMDGLRFTVDVGGQPRTYLTSFSGVVQSGQLQRIWGVARDITDLVELHIRLQREQERLKVFARQLVTAEEKARRAAAVDLHDGIGQALVTMGMTLEAARSQAQQPVRALLDDLRALLRDVQDRTRSMIADLSPPGLYDLGLEPALQWLAVYVRGHDRLRVDLDCQLREEAIPVDTRVLIFKLVRELLRNVVKHAGVSAARVQVRGDLEQLRVEVRDEGSGFEWQPDFFAARARGFGLWSIADRVREAGGEFRVDTAPGRGALVQLSIPLRRRANAETQQAAQRPAGSSR